MRARAVAVPAWAWLTAIVVCSAIVRILLTRQMAAPWIMVDELVYSELAKSFAEHGRFLIRGVPTGGYGYVYPILIAPAWRLYSSIPHAYAVAKGINAVVISLTAIPAYFLARRLVGSGLALVAALLAVLVPSMLYAGTLMTENAFYPLFTCVCLAPRDDARAAERSQAGRAARARAARIPHTRAGRRARAGDRDRAGPARLDRAQPPHAAAGHSCRPTRCCAAGRCSRSAATVARGRSPLQPARRIPRRDLVGLLRSAR